MPNEFTPPVIQGWTYVYIGKGLAKYTKTVTQTGSAIVTPFPVNGAHRLVSLAGEDLTSGSPDTTGWTLLLQRFNYNSHTFTILTATSVSSQPNPDSILMIFGVGYEADTTNYLVSTNATNADTVDLEFTVQYLIPKEVVVDGS